jgi:modulator of FtsH protease HflK
MAWDLGKLQQQRSSAGDGLPPQVSEIINKVKGLKGKFPALWFVIIVLLIFYLGSSTFYTVGVDEVGIVQKFGKYAKTTPPGLNFKLPSGIEKTAKVKVKRASLQGRPIFPSPLCSPGT